MAGLKINPLAALIAPLAGLALLGAASAVAVNPVLLKLVTIRGKREADLPDQPAGLADQSADRADQQADQQQLRARLKQLRLLDTFLSSMPGILDAIPSSTFLLIHFPCSCPDQPTVSSVSCRPTAGLVVVFRL